MAEGHSVQLAKDGRDVLRMVQIAPPELLILDLDMPYVSGLTILKEIQNLKIRLPVLIHTLLTEYEKHPAVQRAAGFLEKRGDNIDGFKATVADLLRKCYPHRFSSRPGTGGQPAEYA
jgi:CheY-like chemotaxis protein